MVLGNRCQKMVKRCNLFTPIRDYQTILFCSPDFTEGEAYEIYLGGELLEEDRDGFYSYGTVQGGELYETFIQDR